MVPDFQIKPIFELHVWCGDDRGKPRYELYDVMHVEDDEWEKSGFPYHDVSRNAY